MLVSNIVLLTALTLVLVND